MNYILATLFLYFSHAIPSAPRVRQALFESLGQRNFRIFYSVLSSVAGLWFVLSYVATDLSAQLFSPFPGAAHLALLMVPAALFLMIARISTKYGELAAPLAAEGIYRITRFPGSLGILLWSLVHLLATGDLKRVIAFATFMLIALTALIKNEIVLRRQTGDEAKLFRMQTSLVPFACFLGGRAQSGNFKLAMSEIGWGRPLVSLLLFFAALFLHPIILGVDPLLWL